MWDSLLIVVHYFALSLWYLPSLRPCGKPGLAASKDDGRMLVTPAGVALWQSMGGWVFSCVSRCVQDLWGPRLVSEKDYWEALRSSPSTEILYSDSAFGKNKTKQNTQKTKQNKKKTTKKTKNPKQWPIWMYSCGRTSVTYCWVRRVIPRTVCVSRKRIRSDLIW